MSTHDAVILGAGLALLYLAFRSPAKQSQDDVLIKQGAKTFIKVIGFVLLAVVVLGIFWK